MTVLTSERSKTRRRGRFPTVGRFGPIGILAGEKLFQGGVVSKDTAGFLVSGRTSTTDVVLGINPNPTKESDNTTGASGDIAGEAETGVHLMDNSSGGEEIKDTEIGLDCFLVDDQTVTKTAGGTRVRAGIVIAVTGDGVFVQFAPVT